MHLFGVIRSHDKAGIKKNPRIFNKKIYYCWIEAGLESNIKRCWIDLESLVHIT